MTGTDEILSDVVNADRNGTNDMNKAAAIRKAFQILTADAKPLDVVEYLRREHNIEVSAAYVSVVKGQLMRKVNAQSFESMRLARKLIRETGSIPNARAAIEAVQEEQERACTLRNLYEAQVAEIDVRLEDTDRPMQQSDRRELTNEKRRIQKLLDALGEF